MVEMNRDNSADQKIPGCYIPQREPVGIMGFGTVRGRLSRRVRGSV